MKLNLGSGVRPLEGYINIDKSRKVHPDKRIDLEDGLLPYETESIEEICATHILEHIRNLIPLMNECYRVLQRGGKMVIAVPQNEGTWGDPTHVRAFSKLSWRYFCGYPLSDAYGITARFKLIEEKFIDNEDGGVLVAVLQK